MRRPAAMPAPHRRAATVALMRAVQLVSSRARVASVARSAVTTVAGLAVCVAVVGNVPAASAAGGPAVLATVTKQTAIAAGGGWVVWSSPDASGHFDLVASHHGIVATLPVQAQAQPFDADVGTDAAGRVVATFSRCRVPPVTSFDWVTRDGVACSARVVDLASGTERSAGIPRPKGASDTFPSMWAGRIAFARQDPRHKDVEQVLLWSLRTRRLTVLPHGVVPTSCPYRKASDCVGQPVSGTVLGLDLGSRLVSFLWSVEAPAVVGHGGYEVRTDRLSDRRSVLVGSGFLGEACTGGHDGVFPSPPVSQGASVWYAQLTSTCYAYASTLERYATSPRLAGASGPLDGIVLQVARDGTDLYALVAPPNLPDDEPTCDQPARPCTIQRIATPALTAVRRLPSAPVF